MVGQRSPGTNSELGEDVAQVKLDPLDADVQLGGGLPVGPARRDQPGNSQLGSAQAERARTGLVPELNAARGEFLLAGQHVGTCTEPGQPLAGSAQPGDRLRPPGRLAEPPAVVQFELSELKWQVNAARVVPCILEGLRGPGQVASSAG